MEIISILSEIRREEKRAEKIGRLFEEYERANLESGECRQGTGITTSLGEKLCRLQPGHDGPHSPRKGGMVNV